MIDPTLINAFRDVFKARPIEVRADNCLNRRHKDAGCQRCTDACPSPAITLTDGRPLLDEPQCVNCGACLRVCPTDVFVLPRTPEADLLRTHIELPLEPVGLICPVHQSPERSSMPVQKVLRHKRCLAGFSPEHLLTLAADGERPLWLDDSYCERCPIGHAHETIAQAVTTANQLLAAYGRPAAVFLQQKDGETLAEEVHPVRILESGQPELSRRGLFRMLGGRVQQQAADVIDYLPEPKPGGPVPVAERLPQHIPTSRRRLNEHLAGLAPPVHDPPADFAIPTGDIPHGNVLIDKGACTACELCARFCPTGALRFDTHEPATSEDAHPGFELSFRPDLCLDCNICVVICPEDAVTMSESLALRALVEPRWEARVSGELVECAQCEAPTRLGDEGEETLCSVCRRGGGGVHKPGMHTDLVSDLFRHTGGE